MFPLVDTIARRHSVLNIFDFECAALLSNFKYNIYSVQITKVGTYSIHRLDSHLSYIH